MLASRVAPEKLRASEIRGNFAALAAQGFQLLLYTGTAVVLARLIAPRDYGVFGIAYGIIAFLGVAKDSGLIAPVVQSESLTRAQMDTLYWYAAGGGLLLMLTGIAAAPVAGWFYADARLVPLIRILAVTLLAGGLSSQHRALLRRQMRFSTLAVCEAVATAAGCAAGIVAALRGAGYESLAWLYLTTEILRTALTTAASGWRPGRPRRGTGVRPLLHFGGLLLAFDFIGYLNYQFDNLLVGWALGPTALGSTIRPTSFPAAGQPDCDACFGRSAIRSQRRAKRSCGLSRVAAAQSASHHGPGYAADRVPLRQCTRRGEHRVRPQVAAFGAGFPGAGARRFPDDGHGVRGVDLSLAAGRARRQLGWSLFITAITIAAFFTGLKWGVTGVAWGFSISRIALFLPTLIYTCAGSPVTWTGLLRIAARPAAASLVSMAVSLAAGRMLGAGPWALAANALLFAAAYAVCWTLPGGRAAVSKSSPIRLGVITSEFFDPRVSRLGGSGWATRLLGEIFSHDSSARVEVVYLARELRESPGSVHGARVIHRRASRWGNLRAMRRESLDLLLTIDYPPDTVYLRSAPRTPAIFWVRIPRTPEDVRKIRTLRIPCAESEEPQGLWCADCSTMTAIVRESHWCGRRLIFATPAPHLAEKLAAAYGIGSPDMHLLPNVIARQAVRIVKSARPSVVFLGRLDPIKRPWIFAALAARHPHADFLFLGQSHFEGPGSWRAANLPSNLRLLGHVGEEEKFSVLREAWAAVNTSIHEGLAISMLEALACETPLVACQDPGAVVSRHGLYTGRFDGSGMEGLAAFSDALQTLLDDPNRRRELGGSGRAWVEATHSRSRFLECFARLCELAGVAR